MSPGISLILRPKGPVSSITIRFLIDRFSVHSMPIATVLTLARGQRGFRSPVARDRNAIQMKSSTSAWTRSALREGRHDLPVVEQNLKREWKSSTGWR